MSRVVCPYDGCSWESVSVGDAAYEEWATHVVDDHATEV